MSRRGDVVVAGRWAAAVARRPLQVILAVAVLVGGSVYYAVDELGFDSDVSNLVDPALPFRQTFDRYAREFPQYQDTLVAVVEAPTPEGADVAAEQLAGQLAASPGDFPNVYRPGRGEFLARHGLLYANEQRLTRMADRLAQAQPLLARIVREPHLGGLFDTLRLAVERDAAADPGFAPVFTAVADSLAADPGERVPVSWQRLLRGGDATSAEPARALVVAAPRIDHDRVMAGRAPLEALRAQIAALPDGLAPVNIRVTGDVALRQEEIESALAGAERAGLLALAGVALVLYVALRSAWWVAVALTVLLAGLALSAGMATAVVGHLNLISVAFAVLYVGLGINYAIHYLLRYRDGLVAGLDRHGAIERAGARLGGPLALCTVTTAIGFFSFLPTAYAGVAELGLIAGLAMFITLAVTYTLLPAMLARLPVRADMGPVAAPTRRWARVLAWPVRYGPVVRLGAVVLAVGGLALAAHAEFDADPLNLRDPQSESVATLRDLLGDGEPAHRSAAVLVDDPGRIDTLQRELEALDTVERTVALDDLVPGNQQHKLALIEDMALLLGPALASGRVTLTEAPPSEVVDAADGLRRALGEAGPAAGPAAGRLHAALGNWLEASRADADRARDVADLQQAVLGTLPAALDRLRTALRAGPVEAGDLPEDLRQRYRSDRGTHLIRVLPAIEHDDPDQRRRFVETVAAVAPAVTGPTVLQVESGDAVVDAFQKALAMAIAGIAAVLLVLLRNVSLTLKVLVPLVLGGLLTIAAMVLLGIPFNFANVIALPLLVGVGVDNGIHVVSRYRERGRNPGELVRTSTARAVLFGSLTTVVSFGNLATSSHAGMASMGLLLALGMVLIVLTTLVILPCLLRSGGRGQGAVGSG